MRAYVVKQGDHLPGITEAFGFGHHEALWDHPDNAELKEKRGTPEILMPGDRLVVPDRKVKSVDTSTGKIHHFVVEREPLGLRVRVRDLASNPVAGASCVLTVGGQAHDLTTDGEGALVAPIDRSERHATLALANDIFDIGVGELDPIDEESGWQGRLVNLGYLEASLPAPASGDDDAARARELRAALEEFQCDQGLPLSGQMDNATGAKLLDVHGC